MSNWTRGQCPRTNHGQQLKKSVSCSSLPTINSIGFKSSRLPKPKVVASNVSKCQMSDGKVSNGKVSSGKVSNGSARIIAPVTIRKPNVVVMQSKPVNPFLPVTINKFNSVSGLRNFFDNPSLPVSSLPYHL